MVIRVNKRCRSISFHTNTHEYPRIIMNILFLAIYLGINSVAEDLVDDDVDVGDVDGAVVVDVACRVGGAAQDDIDDDVDVGNVDGAVTVHVARSAISWYGLDVVENAPRISRLIVIERFGRDVEVSGIVIVRESVRVCRWRCFGQASYTRQAGTSSKSIVANGCDGVADGHAHHASATIERTPADGGDGIRDCHTRQSSAVLERTGTDGGDGVGDSDTGQAGATLERISADFGDGVGDD